MPISVRPELVEGEGKFFKISRLDFAGSWFDGAHHERDRLTLIGGRAHHERYHELSSPRRRGSMAPPALAKGKSDLFSLFFQGDGCLGLVVMWKQAVIFVFLAEE